METVRIGKFISMEKPRKALTSAGAFLVRKNADGDYQMIVVHEKWENGKETYMLPKGRAQDNEILEETARREVTEETGYTDFKLLRYIGSRTYEMDLAEKYYIKTDHYYLAILESENRIDLNLEDYEKDIRIDAPWVSIEEGFKLLTYPGENNEEFFKTLKNALKELN